MLLLLALTSSGYLTQSCRTKQEQKEESTTAPAPLAKAPVFNADSAYGFVQKQVDFGPRVPNTAAHRATGDWILSKLKSYGFTTQEQPFTPTTFDGTRLNARNLIGSYNPGAAKRILLAAHWDTRPFADKDPDPKARNLPFDGANDGGSGVAILLEIARLIGTSELKPDVGIDLIFFDAEDWGEREGMNPAPDKNNWALGSQYWAKNPHQPGYSAYFGILVDLVGAKGAKFPKEGYSVQYAASVTQQVWDIASRLGYDSYFLNQQAGGLNDDHIAVNEVAKIPMIDIVEMKLNSDKTFGDYHHTRADNMAVIDRSTLKAVGQTVTQVIYQEE